MDEDIDNEDVPDYQGPWPGASILSPQKCTASDGTRCHILDQLPAYNKLLRVIQSELVEGTPDKLALVSVPSSTEHSATEAERREACAHIFWLLKSHRCLDSVVLAIEGEFQDHQKLILRGLRVAPALRELEITVAFSSLFEMPTFSRLSFLTLLGTLECALVDCPETAPMFGRLIETSVSLTTLTLDLTSYTVPYGRELWDAVATCKLLNSLHAHFQYHFETTKDDYLPLFEYLGQASALRSVDVALDFGKPSRWLKYLLRALCGSKRLVNVTLEWFVVGFEETVMIEEFLTGNSAVRTFELRRCFGPDDDANALPRYDTDDFGTLTPLITPWLSILRKNHVLQKLHLNFSSFSPAECVAFLEELARNRNLRSVSIEDFQEYCCSLSRPGHRDSDSGRFGTKRDRLPEIILAECDQIRHVILDMLTPEDLTWFERAVLPLDLPRRVSHFQLGLREVDPRQETVCAIAEFIETSNTLSRLVLDFRQWDIDPETSSMSEFRRTILKAVHRNTSIQYLALWYDDCPSPDAEELACTVGESKTMCYLDLDLGPSAGRAFLSRLLSIIWHNYTVISVYMEGIPDAAKLLYDNLLGVLTRNWRLVGRAAKFAAGSSSPFCAESIEFVSSNPALVKELCELASVDEIEASRMISESLRGLQAMDAFMQISGIVERRVVCRMNISGGLQLDDVDEYSWRSVRKYLRLADIQK